jgi:hypothetical protein
MHNTCGNTCGLACGGATVHTQALPNARARAAAALGVIQPVMYVAQVCHSNCCSCYTVIVRAAMAARRSPHLQLRTCGLSSCSSAPLFKLCTDSSLQSKPQSSTAATRSSVHATAALYCTCRTMNNNRMRPRHHPTTSLTCVLQRQVGQLIRRCCGGRLRPRHHPTTEVLATACWLYTDNDYTALLLESRVYCLLCSACC